jgi:tetratricopeptide (TPR) repeat protein
VEVFRSFCLWLALGAQAAFAADLALEPNSYFKSPDEIRQYLVDNTDLGGTIDALQLAIGPDGTYRLSMVEENRQVGEGGERTFDSASDFMDYSYARNELVGGSGRMAGIAFCKGNGCHAQTPKSPKDQLDKAKIVARYYVKAKLPQLLEDQRNEAFEAYRTGKKIDSAKAALEMVKNAPWTIVPIAAENVEYYNDLGFFLEQGGKYKEAVPVLEEVTRAVPDRTPALLNLGDAYAGISDAEHAKAAYRRYQKLMEQAGNGAKIPKRIQKYLGK